MPVYNYKLLETINSRDSLLEEFDEEIFILYCILVKLVNLKVVPLLQSDFNYVDCLKAIRYFNVKGCIISEGPMVEKDALLLKKTFERL
ncbi:MAG: hypothetical protein P4L59_18780 [Desulfosporosinus sp.]|nr:hypothetical protein [Desulfosporosinus sp.]